MVSPKNIPAFFERSAVTSALFPPFIVPSGFNGNLGICGADGARWELGWAGGGNPLGAELPLPTVPRGAVFAGSSSSSATTSDPCRAPGDASTPMVSEPARASPATTTPPTSVAQPGVPAAIPFGGLAVEIAGRAIAGKNRFEIRLDPPELGRIEVRLDVDRDGNVTSRLTVDRADTFDLLRRDAAGLERALQDAGLKTAGNGLQFSLRDQPMSQQQTGGGSDTAQIVMQDDMLSLGEQYGAKIFSLLDDDELREISIVMSSLGTIEAESVEQLLLEFVGRMSASGALLGNYDATERLLKQYLPAERVGGIMPFPRSTTDFEGARPVIVAIPAKP